MFEIMKLKERKCGSQYNSVPVPTYRIRLPKPPIKPIRNDKGNTCSCQANTVNKRKDKADNKLASKEIAKIIIYFLDKRPVA